MRHVFASTGAALIRAHIKRSTTLKPPSYVWTRLNHLASRGLSIRNSFNRSRYLAMSHSTEPNHGDSSLQEIDAAHRSHPTSEAGPSTTKSRKGPPKKRDTHFLCFPLVTETSVPQLAESLTYFRTVSTKPGRAQDNRPTQGHNELHQTSTATAADNGNEIEPNPNLSLRLQDSSPELQILPAIAHRPPGTFHLTLGVMDLSEEAEMARALSLLEELDYADIFQRTLAAERGQSLIRESSEETSIENQVENSVISGDNAEKLTSLNRAISPPPCTSPKATSTTFNAVHPPQISLSGLSTFPSAKSSRVFYAKPSPIENAPFPLLKFGQAIRLKFREAGFITETRPLVLHATVANMRYAVQARGGRTSKGKSWRFGKDRWTDGQVDARELIKCFDLREGNVEEYVRGRDSLGEQAKEFVWASNIELNRVAICKMGAEKSDDQVLGMVYPPVGEKRIFA